MTVLIDEWFDPFRVGWFGGSLTTGSGLWPPPVATIVQPLRGSLDTVDFSLATKP
jgi:hypothetical protein